MAFLDTLGASQPSSGGFMGNLGQPAPAPTTSFSQPPSLTQSLWNGLVGFGKTIASPAVTMAARPFQALSDAGDYLGTQIEANKAPSTTVQSAILSADQQRAIQNQTTNSGPLGLVAPTPANAADVKKDVGRGIQTVALGLGPEAGGAALGVGNSLEQGNNLFSVDTAVQAVAGLFAGKALDIVGKPIFNAAGKVVSSITPELIQNISTKGASAIQDFAAAHNILPQQVSQVINTAADAADSAANKPFQAVSNTVSNMTKGAPAVLMNKVARINPSDASAFSKMSGGKTPGQFLDERGIYGSTQNVTAQLFQRFSQAKEAVDTALESLPGLYKNQAVETALKDVVGNAHATSGEGAPSPYLSQAETLLGKMQNEGLSMTDINAAKRLYESTVKLNYIKDGVSTGIERANNIDSAIRTWQQDTADRLGFTNIKDLNKETQLSKSLLDAIGKKNNAQTGNNLVGLTDWIVASGLPHDPSTLALLLGKKFFGASGTKGAAARLLSSGEKVGSPSAELGAMNTNPAQLRLPGQGGTTPGSNLPPVVHGRGPTLEDSTGINTYPQNQPSTPPTTNSSIKNNIDTTLPRRGRKSK